MGVASAYAVDDWGDWPGDERVVTRFLAGDTRAFEQIVKRYAGMVFGLAARLVGPAEAEDVVQETFLRAYRGLEAFRGECSLKTWLYAIAVNRARARRGFLSKLGKLFTTPSGGRVPGGAGPDDPILDLDSFSDGAPSPEENALRAEQRRRLRGALGRLPEEFRTAVVLRDLEGCSYEEIASILRVPVGTVRSRIARGRLRLKESLSVEGESPRDRAVTPSPPGGQGGNGGEA